MQMHMGDQFGLEWTDYDPNRIKTILIVHGFLSHGAASWVLEMTQALLDWVSYLPIVTINSIPNNFIRNYIYPIIFKIEIFVKIISIRKMSMYW